MSFAMAVKIGVLSLKQIKLNFLSNFSQMPLLKSHTKCDAVAALPPFPNT